MLKPERLKKGDAIALLSPSMGLASLFPHRIEAAKKYLVSLGFNTREYPTTRKSKGWSAGTPEERAKDIMDAFTDESVKAILCTIGGMVANQVLKHLDFDLIKENPKIFCGYSDISVLHYAILKKTGMVTFYGPAAMTQFAEYPKPLDYTARYFMKAICEPVPIGKIEPSEKWTEEYLDWSTREDQKKPRKLVPNKGFEVLCDGKARGHIIGGCLTSLMHLRGTKYWPDHKNKILFLDIPEGQEFGKGEPISYTDSYLTDLELSDIFSEIKGLIIGRLYRQEKSDAERLKDILKKIGIEYSIPVIYGIDLGHTDPMITIPLCVKTGMEGKLIMIEESGVR